MQETGRCDMIAGSSLQAGRTPANRVSWRKNMAFFDFGTIFFLIAAVVIFFQLRSVLGRRTGREKPPFDPYTAGRQKEDAPAAPENVVSLPRRKPAEPSENDAV